MASKQIEDLPDEIIIEIFKYLDNSSLSNVALSCKRFHISDEIPRGLNLDFTIQQQKITERHTNLMKSKRRFEKIVISECLTFNEDLVQLFQLHGAHILELHLFDCVIDKTENFRDILNSMPKLRRIVMKSTMLCVGSKDLPVEELPELPNLTTLEYVKSQYKLLKWFHKPQIINFKILNKINFYQSTQNEFVEFLESQKKLESLAIRSMTKSDSDLFTTPVDTRRISFRLKKLSLVLIDLETDNFRNLVEFIEPHLKTIEELELSQTIHEPVVQLVFMKMKNLKSLKISTQSLPGNSDFYEFLEDNASVKRLIVSGEIRDSDLFKDFLRRLPNIETLVSEYCLGEEVTRFVSENLTHISTLDIGEAKGEVLDSLVFPALKTFRTQFIFEDIDWWAFSQHNPGITEIHIENLESDMFQILEIMMNVKLEVLCIDSSSVSFDKNILNVIQSFCSHLKVMKLPRFMVKKVDPASLLKIRGLYIHDRPKPKNSKKPMIGDFWDARDYGNFLPDSVADFIDDFEDMLPDEVDELMDHLGINDDDWYDNYDDYDGDNDDDGGDFVPAGYEDEQVDFADNYEEPAEEQVDFDDYEVPAEEQVDFDDFEEPAEEQVDFDDEYEEPAEEQVDFNDFEEPAEEQVDFDDEYEEPAEEQVDFNDYEEPVEEQVDFDDYEDPAGDVDFDDYGNDGYGDNDFDDYFD